MSEDAHDPRGWPYDASGVDVRTLRRTPDTLREAVRVALGPAYTKDLEDRVYFATRDFFRGMKNRLEEPLRKYASCRHGMVNCSCTMEARAALFEQP